MQWTLLFIAGHRKSKIDKFADDLNPGLALITDWIISSGNTTLSVDMMVTCLEQMQREDIVEIIRKGQGDYCGLCSRSSRSKEKLNLYCYHMYHPSTVSSA